MPQLTDIDLGGYPTGRALRDAAAKLLAKLIPWARIKVRDSKHEENAVIIEPTAPPPGAANSQQSAAPPPAVFPFDAATALKHQEAWAKHLGVPVEFTNGVGMKFRLIPPGEFQMGLGPEFTDEELKRLAGEKNDLLQTRLGNARPAHSVRITRPFYMQVDEVSTGRYRDIVGQLRPEMSQDPNKPLADYVAFPDAITFCNQLSEREGKRPAYRIEAEKIAPLDDADGYRLPTEAQWEYACRAGTNTLWYFGNEGSANSVEFRKQCAAVNPFGLIGLYGGADEWCWDGTQPHSAYSAALLKQRDDPREDIGPHRIKRGGSSYDSSGADRRAINSFRRGSSPATGTDLAAIKWSGVGRVVLPIALPAQTAPRPGNAPPTATTSAGSATTTSDSLDRQVAQRLLDLKLPVRLIVVGKVTPLKPGSPLPAEPFVLIGIDAGAKTSVPRAELVKLLGDFRQLASVENTFMPTQDCDLWAEVFAAIPSIKAVNAASCEELSDVGAGHLARLPKLEYVNIGSSLKITGVGLAAFAQCKTLTTIELNQAALEAGKFTLADIQKLQNALPRTRVVFGGVKPIPGLVKPGQ
ncbi:MAG: SUMF1/EgtB/PvdO family nonheme iron enzyme [Planctomycetaceae bacterium]|nr:SUMF1/EgtB/PvdO family nonheme iron enzyme [Planctomycetaceae bacterium]